MGNSPVVHMRLTRAQARCVNAALALYEAEDHEYDEDFDADVLSRARTAVHRAMEAAGVEP